MSNLKIRTLLNLSEETYANVREELLQARLVEKYACYGGGIRLTRKGKRHLKEDQEPKIELKHSSGTGFFVSSGHAWPDARRR